jgi:hypothetical protein
MNAKTIIGSDNWQFLTNDSNNIIGQITGEINISKNQYDSWIKLLKSREHHLAKLNIKQINIITRNKEWHLRNYLPKKY